MGTPENRMQYLNAHSNVPWAETKLFGADPLLEHRSVFSQSSPLSVFGMYNIRPEPRDVYLVVSGSAVSSRYL